ncbi:MAG TPA: DUF2844 domain-containing protein [Steroidobacteraceae bacterium]|nr:DUF2844 domain-containing protein [Steroidobacteraceae bacterium]
MSPLRICAPLIPRLLAAMMLTTGVAEACLGGNAASVQADAAALGGEVRTSTLLGYDVQEIDVPGGLSVREFVGRDGIVFGLGWSGPAPADLPQLLGDYLAEFTAGAAAAARPGLRRGVRIELPDLVVEAGGHLRAYTGRALLPALLLAGVAPADIH